MSASEGESSSKQEDKTHKRVGKDLLEMLKYIKYAINPILCAMITWYYVISVRGIVV